MKIKCVCILFADITRQRKGTFNDKDRIISIRPSLFEKVYIVVPKDVVGYPIGKGRLLFLVDQKNLLAVGHGSVNITSAEAQDLITKLNLIARNKYWQFLSGRAMDLIETLITMGAGYGFLRLAEFFIEHAFGH